MFEVSLNNKHFFANPGVRTEKGEEKKSSAQSFFLIRLNHFVEKSRFINNKFKLKIL